MKECLILRESREPAADKVVQDEGIKRGDCLVQFFVQPEGALLDFYDMTLTLEDTTCSALPFLCRYAVLVAEIILSGLDPFRDSGFVVQGQSGQDKTRYVEDGD